MGSYSPKDIVVEISGTDGTKYVIDSFSETIDMPPYTFLHLAHVNGNDVSVPISKELYDEFIKKGFLNVK